MDRNYGRIITGFLLRMSYLLVLGILEVLLREHKLHITDTAQDSLQFEEHEITREVTIFIYCVDRDAYWIIL